MCLAEGPLDPGGLSDCGFQECGDDFVLGGAGAVVDVVDGGLEGVGDGGAGVPGAAGHGLGGLLLGLAALAVAGDGLRGDLDVVVLVVRRGRHPLWTGHQFAPFDRLRSTPISRSTSGTS
ncbi:hypothetical protein STSU_000030 (plasmid) [Streptomyces tsukubensis NRRL18488]|uniref:Uncharacterized protein n=1 Tax=Streptomyces tsukubensis (strain DSM 42081 / NBRC 108919 / NRRL 18488 / 9993) TaxID=1114943 RepID=A0A7G3U5V8_STRT9|nr:hypothetical protein STSU_000030 [Streptomyces tsukubensis NRRL18488]